GGRPARILPPQDAAELEGGRIEEDLRDRAAIDMHLLVLGLIEQHVDHHGGKQAWYRRRGEYDLAHEVQPPGMAAGRDCADVPNDELAGVEIGGGDEQEAALL